MKYEEFVTKFKSQSTNLSQGKQLSLAISVCKKLFFDYQEFSEKNNWGDTDLLLDAINLSEKFFSQKINVTTLIVLLPKIDEITPDTEDFENASYALNACRAVYETLEFLIDNKPEHIYNIGTYLTDTVDFKIQQDDELTEDQIDRHPLMVETREYLIEATK